MKVINKLIRQYGEKGNDYSVLEIGDTLNDVIDLLMEKGVVAIKENKVEPKPVPAIPKAPKKDAKGGYCARSPATADMVYYVLGEEKSWIKNPETLKKLGFGFHDVVNLTNEEMNKLKRGDPINLSEKKPLEIKQAKDGFDKYNL